MMMRLKRNGFATFYTCVSLLSLHGHDFAMGLTKVRFGDYFFGTGLGSLWAPLFFTFFVGTVKRVWVSGDWGELLSFKIVFSWRFLSFSFFIPNCNKA